MQVAAQKDQTADVMSELRALNARFIHNFVTRDVASHDAILHPAFINTHNYLTCEGKPDKKWYVEGVSRVDYDKASGIAVYGFFFSKPECDLPTFQMEAITAEPNPA